MNGKKTPLQVVNEDHGGKTKLVDKIVGLIERGEEEKDSLKARLLKASNKKLLRIASVSSTIREKYGSTEKLVDSVAQSLNRAKDSDFVKRLAANTPARLLDLARSLAGEARRPMKMGIHKPVEKAPAPAKKVAARPVKGKGGKGPAKKKAAPAKAAAAKKKSQAKKSSRG
jgi:hypothetical protein